MLAPQLGYGGAEKSFIRLANFLSEYHDVTIAVFTAGFVGNFSTGAEKANCPIVYLSTAGEGRVKRWLGRWRRFRRLKLASDVAISFLPGANLLNALTARRTPTIVSVRGSRRHDLDGASLSRLLWKRGLDPLVYRLASCITTASTGLAEEVKETFPQAAGKLLPIEGFIDSRALACAAEGAIEPEFEALKAFPTVVACGRLHPQKGFQHLIPIFAAVRGRLPSAKLLLIGDGPDLDALYDTALQLGLVATREVSDGEQADVIFAGYREDPIKYFRVGTVFAFTSLYEGLPNALIEAVASGVPLLAADCPWGAGAVLDGQSGVPHLQSDKKLPADLRFGTLMPRLGTEDSHRVWQERLEALLKAPRPRASPQARRAGTSQFDLEVSGTAWLRLIGDLV